MCHHVWTTYGSAECMTIPGLTVGSVEYRSESRLGLVYDWGIWVLGNTGSTLRPWATWMHNAYDKMQNRKCGKWNGFTENNSLQECGWDVHLLYLGCWDRRWTGYTSLWYIVGQYSFPIGWHEPTRQTAQLQFSHFYRGHGSDQTRMPFIAMLHSWHCLQCWDMWTNNSNSSLSRLYNITAIYRIQFVFSCKLNVTYLCAQIFVLCTPDFVPDYMPD